MKNIKLYLMMCNVALVATTAKAQKHKSESTKCISQGKFIVDVYYGYPYVMGELLKNSISTLVTDAKINNRNHLGAKFEYMANDMVGMGIDYTYATITSNFVETGHTEGHHKSQESLTKQRFLLRINVHFATTENLDPYTITGFGYKQTTWKSDYDSDIRIPFLNTAPLAFRFGAGLRWFFTDNVGINVEAGIGGPIIQGGISVKL